MIYVVLYLLASGITAAILWTSGLRWQSGDLVLLAIFSALWPFFWLLAIVLMVALSIKNRRKRQ